MNFLLEALSFIADGANWSGANGLGQRLLAHLGYTLAAVTIAAVVALPLGVLMGHTRRGVNGVVAVSGALRALPSLGLLTWLALEFSFGVRMPVIPAIMALVILAIPPMLAGTVTGVTAIPRGVVDSARAAGFSESDIVRQVELPLAAPSIVGGIRSAAVQVLATATIVAYIGLSGLGRYLIDGLALRDYPQMLVGALMVALLALAVDGVLALCQRLLRPNTGMRN
ncbi:TPA: ABC transporter permease [Corynebacterium striatum]|uniref:ABC transporter permease n=1 Tax=Corynebacterium striatum TaxID=43770 RepID=UPI001027848C|nr:ABC transporter permease [Corynebacterium striatum]VFB06288.1 ABC-type proline/glycine betaine transporter, permease [Corynebacterium striatum]HCD2523684.1 ABC transporter permease [Corynebacterium striatum]HCD3161746.1 ABC transporter permease [Corynebacterium striatum]HCD3683424.1 ABC transporter permease [Corynebacterium striatum]HCD4756692.1 ABC transporter permease [Corynebacterium striatum]